MDQSKPAIRIDEYFECALSTVDMESPVESTPLSSLVSHQFAVAADDPVGHVYRRFEQSGHEFAAVLTGRQVVGICSRGQIGFLLGSRYGFSIFGSHSIRQHLVDCHLQVVTTEALRTVLIAALDRKGDRFYDDVVLVEPDGSFCGFITVETLVKKQSELLAEQMGHLQSQQSAVSEKNRALFRSLNELRQSRGRYEILFQNSALAVALLTPSGEIEAHNHRLEILLGGALGLERRFNVAQLVRPADRPAFEKFLLDLEPAAGAPPTARSGEFHLDLPGVRQRIFKFYGSWIPETSQVCVCLDDITEQRLIERTLVQKEKQMLLETLVGGISHEINNKLSPILGFAELMQISHGDKSGWSEQMNQYCEAIQNSAKEAGHIVRQLLRLSRPPDGEPEPCDLNAVLNDALVMLQFNLRSAGVTPVLNASAVPVVVFADAAQLKQVIINLVLNALDAMQHSQRRELDLSLVDADGRARLTVRDSGEGIAPENLKRIFDPFFTTKGPDRGTGLGLSVCASIVRQYGGEMSVESTPGSGSIFTMSLPISDVSLETSSITRRRRTAERAPVRESVSRVRILVVDDEEYITHLIHEVLRERVGCIVVRASNVDGAIRKIEEDSFDAIISDIRMPGRNGTELLRWLSVFRPQMAGRFCFVTGDASVIDVQEEFGLDRVPVLRKPFQVESLVEMIECLLAGRGAMVGRSTRKPGELEGIGG